MKQALLELVDVILRKIQEYPEGAPSETGIRSWLVRQGYTKRDIDAALNLVRPRMASLAPISQRGPGSIRQLSPYEELKLSPEARNALVRLELYELIDPSEREMILERLDQFEGEVGLPELDYLVSWITSPNRDVEAQQTLYNVFEDRKETLH